MNLKLAVLVPLCWILGCATPIHVKVQDSIHKGDSVERVKEVLGEPDSFAPSQRVPGATAWYYESNGSVCGFTINNEKVDDYGCDSTNYRGTASRILGGFGTVLQGAGQGLQNSSRGSTNCTTTGSSGIYNTNCH